MHRDPRMYLYDIASAADAIMIIIAGQTRDGYIEDDLVRSVVEQKFEIIGEASTGEDCAGGRGRISDASAAVAFRDVLTRAYMLVDHDIVWRTAINSLPGLRANVMALLEELSSLHARYFQRASSRPKLRAARRELRTANPACP